MPTPEELEAADLFPGKAASDLAAARLLAGDGDGDQDDNVVGFHAQRAVETALKAWWPFVFLRSRDRMTSAC